MFFRFYQLFRKRIVQFSAPTNTPRNLTRQQPAKRSRDTHLTPNATTTPVYAARCTYESIISYDQAYVFAQSSGMLPSSASCFPAWRQVVLPVSFRFFTSILL